MSAIAACFAEPIQGEGGVREVPDDLLRALRELANRHGAALVFDEIQCGMGRTGSFLASTKSGVRADYYLFPSPSAAGWPKSPRCSSRPSCPSTTSGGITPPPLPKTTSLPR